MLDGIGLSPLLRCCCNTLLEGVIRSSSAYDTWWFLDAHVTLLYIASFCHHIVHPGCLIMYHIQLLFIRYDSSRNHSDPCAGGSVLFHTHTTDGVEYDVCASLDAVEVIVTSDDGS